MAILRIRKSDAIVWQLLRRDLTNPLADFEEYKVYPMAVKPAMIRYSYGSRSAITQTVPDYGFVDRFGSRLTRVTIAGTFGLQPRRQGLTIKDGYTRLLEFRDELFKVSQQARPTALEAALGAEYVYAVNFYDFINDERFAVNLEELMIELNALRNPFEPTYQLSFQSVGPIVRVTTTDIMLGVLLDIDGMLESALSLFSSVINLIEGNAIFKTISEVEFRIETLLETYNNLVTLFGMYGTAVGGQISTIKNWLSNFSGLSLPSVGSGLSVNVKG